VQCGALSPPELNLYDDWQQGRHRRFGL